MKPAPFDYVRPDTLEQAIGLLAQEGVDARVLAGGQSLVPMMNLRLAQPGLLIDVNRIAGHDYIRREGDELHVGFLARHEEVRQSPLVRATCPLMADAYEHVAHGPIRNRGTLCGNLCHADPASEMPAVMLAAEATMELRGRRGVRLVPAADFFRGPYQTAAHPDEMLVRVRIPVAAVGQGWGFHEVSTRKGDFAFCCVAALLTVRDDRVTSAAIAAAGVGTRAIRLATIERLLIGRRADAESFAAAGIAASQAITPTEDAQASSEYRRDLLDVLTRRALADAASRTR